MAHEDFPVNYKDPQAILDYTNNYADWLGDDTIDSSSWTVQTGITIVAETNTVTSATVWLSGGTIGDRYEVTNEIVTEGGRTENRTRVIIVEQR